MSQPWTRAQIRRVDELAVQTYGISGLILMENAGRSAAEIIQDTYGDVGSTVIFCGTGNNGGDGFVIARHLHNRAWTVRLLLVGDPGRLAQDAGVNYEIAIRMGLPVAHARNVDEIRAFTSSLRSGDVAVDALLGTGFQGRVRSPLAELIGGLNRVTKRSLVAVDLPSGLDCDSGAPSNATIRADLTITFVAAKIGFDQPPAAEFIGRVVVADIGAPRELINLVAGGG